MHGRVMTKLDWQQWAHQEGTKAFMGLLQETKNEAMENWAAGGYADELSNARALGAVSAVRNTMLHIQEMQVGEGVE